MATFGTTVRRGLPRQPGGEPWPPAGTVVPPTVVGEQTSAGESFVEGPHTGTRPLRRGLPRVPGGEPWPPTGLAPATSAIVEDPVELAAPSTRERAATGDPGEGTRVSARPEPKRYGPFTRSQWARAIALGGVALLILGTLAVLVVRWFLDLEFMQDFVATYPGEYHLPEETPVGIPPWLGWQHFFNVFLMVLIVRSGLQVRYEKRPRALWSPRNNPNRKINLALWFHQSLDLIWVVNGLIYVVLLFATGQWMKIVPTSWEVFPNAVSAALQYVSLDWPTENGWVYYNALQQLAYFATVFLAAPLAIITGVRMSGFWPKNATTLSRVYPLEWARAVHFPTMLYFVVFTAVHVFLVFATGALRNLNHMYASQGSRDGSAYADNWVGFVMFVASLIVIAAAVVAARPLLLAPIARLFGTVSGR